MFSAYKDMRIKVVIFFNEKVEIDKLEKLMQVLK